MEKDSLEGLWRATSQMEDGAREMLQPWLSQFQPAVEACYEAGVYAPMLWREVERPEHVRCAALFHKKALTDYRAGWLLLSIGYTSAAAAVFASLWENALTVCHVITTPGSVTEIRKHPEGDVPWKPMELAKHQARRLTADEVKSDLKDAYEATWREVYGPYKWLCKIKHPTVRSAAHDAFSASVKEDEFVVMAAPDVRESDRVTKALLLMIATARLSDATSAFVGGITADHESRDYQAYSARVGVLNASMAVFRNATVSPLAFDIAGETVSKEYRDIRLRELDRQRNT